MTPSKFQDAFQAIAGRLDDMQPDLGAQPFYECLSDAIIWPDEKPAFQMDAEQLGALRILWNYRTSLFRGKPRSEFEDLWVSAQLLAPRWPSFLSERLSPADNTLALVPRKT